MSRPTIGAPIFKKMIMETEQSRIQLILQQLNIAVKGSEEVYYTDKELAEFAHSFESTEVQFYRALGRIFMLF